jgi:hypothetical protein
MRADGSNLNPMANRKAAGERPLVDIIFQVGVIEGSERVAHIPGKAEDLIFIRPTRRIER